MVWLYVCLSFMLLSVISMLCMPFIKQRSCKGLIYILFPALLIIILFYQFSGNKPALYYWLTEGKKHYQLLEQFEQLGGVEGAIIRIEERLKGHPEDSQGWYILGKLYLSKHDDKKAEAAFARARM